MKAKYSDGKKFDQLLLESGNFTSNLFVIVNERSEEILTAFNSKANKISGILTSFYISQTAQEDNTSPSKIEHGLIPPPKLFKIHPSSAPNKTCEDIKAIIQELVLDVVTTLKNKYEKLPLPNSLELENKGLKQEVKKLKDQLEKVTQTYYKELNALREQLFQRHVQGEGSKVTMRFFKVEDGLSPETCVLLNNRIKEIKDGVEEKLKKQNEIIMKLSKENRKYELLTPQDYPLVKMDLVELFAKVKKLYSNDKDKIWNGLSKGMNADYLADLVDEKYGRASAIPKEIIQEEMEKIRAEVIDYVKTANFVLQNQVRELEQKAKNMEQNLLDRKGITEKLLYDKCEDKAAKAWKREAFSINDTLQEVKQDFMFTLDKNHQLERKCKKLADELEYTNTRMEQNELLKVELESLEKLKIPLLQAAIFVVLRYKLLQNVHDSIHSYAGNPNKKMVSSIGTITCMNDIRKEIVYRPEVEEEHPVIYKVATAVQTEATTQPNTATATIVKNERKPSITPLTESLNRFSPDNTLNEPVVKLSKINFEEEEEERGVTPTQWKIRATFRNSRHEVEVSRNKSLLAAKSMNTNNKFDEDRNEKSVQYTHSRNSHQMTRIISCKVSQTSTASPPRKVPGTAIRIRKKSHWEKVLSTTQIANEEQPKQTDLSSPHLVVNSKEFADLSKSPIDISPRLTHDQILDQWKGLVSRKGTRVTQATLHKNGYVKRGKSSKPKYENKRIKEAKYEVPMNISKVGFTNERIKRISKIVKAADPIGWEPQIK